MASETATFVSSWEIWPGLPQLDAKDLGHELHTAAIQANGGPATRNSAGLLFVQTPATALLRGG